LQSLITHGSAELGENTNGLIRQYFPKGTDFREVIAEQVMKVQEILNARPRKRLGFLTPKEKFKQLTKLDYKAAKHYQLEFS